MVRMIDAKSLMSRKRAVRLLTPLGLPDDSGKGISRLKPRLVLFSPSSQTKAPLYSRGRFKRFGIVFVGQADLLRYRAHRDQFLVIVD